jgi:hypothetical protein
MRDKVQDNTVEVGVLEPGDDGDCFGSAASLSKENAALLSPVLAEELKSTRHALPGAYYRWSGSRTRGSRASQRAAEAPKRAAHLLRT